MSMRPRQPPGPQRPPPRPPRAPPIPNLPSDWLIQPGPSSGGRQQHQHQQRHSQQTPPQQTPPRQTPPRQTPQQQTPRQQTPQQQSSIKPPEIKAAFVAIKIGNDPISARPLGTRLLVVLGKNKLGQIRWELPGGGVEDDDRSVKDAAFRELKEEAGLLYSAAYPAGHRFNVRDVTPPQTKGATLFFFEASLPIEKDKRIKAYSLRTKYQCAPSSSVLSSLVQSRSDARVCAGITRRRRIMHLSRGRPTQTLPNSSWSPRSAAS